MYYVTKAEYSLNDCDQAILEKAIDMNQDNLDIWASIMKHYANLKKLKMLEKVLRDGTRALKEKSLRLWEIMNSYLEENNYQTRVRYFYILC